MRRGLFETALHRVQALGLAVLALLLAGCAAGSARPTPAELGPNVDLIGVRQAWQLKLSAVNFPLQVHVQGGQVLLAGSDGALVTLDAASGREVGRARVDATLSAGVGSDGRVSAVVTRANQVVALEEGRELWRHQLGTQSYTAPLVAGGRVFVLGADRSLVALDGRTGTRLWALQRPAEPLVLRQAGVLLPVGNTLVAGLSRPHWAVSMRPAAACSGPVRPAARPALPATASACMAPRPMARCWPGAPIPATAPGAPSACAGASSPARWCWAARWSWATAPAWCTCWRARTVRR